MTTQALAMPDYVAQLIRLPLTRMGLRPSEVQDDVIICPLIYEHGSTLSLLTMCVAKRGWFSRGKPLIVVSIVALTEAMRVAQVYLRETTAVPTYDADVPFMLRYAAAPQRSGQPCARAWNRGWRRVEERGSCERIAVPCHRLSSFLA